MQKQQKSKKKNTSAKKSSSTIKANNCDTEKLVEKKQYTATSSQYSQYAPVQTVIEPIQRVEKTKQSKIELKKEMTKEIIALKSKVSDKIIAAMKSETFQSAMTVIKTVSKKADFTDKRVIGVAGASIGMLTLSAAMLLNMPTSVNSSIQNAVAGQGLNPAVNADIAYSRLIEDQEVSELDFKSLSKMMDVASAQKPSITTYAINVDGKEIACFKSAETAKSALLDLKNRAIPQGIKVDSVGFLETVTVQKNEVSSLEFTGFSTIEALQQKVEAGQSEVASHTISAHDTLSGIAQKYNTSVAELTEANPQIATQKYLKVGEVLNLTKKINLLTVQAKGFKTYTESQKPEIIYQPSNKLFKGDKKLITKGVPAQKEITSKVIFENGQIVSQEILSEKIVQKMVPECYAQGTKDVPVKMVASASGNLNRPAKGYVVFSRFGKRGSGFHTGIDLSMPKGTPIYAAGAGTVVFSANQGSYGLLIAIDHGKGIKTYYSHNSKNLVKVGTVVSKGDLIARTGQTGRATGPHLHFEVRKNNIPVNPERFVDL